MSKSEQIRALAQAGHTVAEISCALGLKYQFAYSVCRNAGLLKDLSARAAASASPPPTKSLLPAAQLLKGGFEVCGKIVLTPGGLAMPTLPKRAGVYSFVLDGWAQYVGVATQSLAQRLNGYARPGPTQTTNLRVKALILGLLRNGAEIHVLVACPPDLEWNGFAISGPVGLEAGLIMRHHLPWNIRGARSAEALI